MNLQYTEQKASNKCITLAKLEWLYHRTFHKTTDELLSHFPSRFELLLKSWRPFSGKLCIQNSTIPNFFQLHKLWQWFCIAQSTRSKVNGCLLSIHIVRINFASKKLSLVSLTLFLIHTDNHTATDPTITWVDWSSSAMSLIGYCIHLSRLISLSSLSCWDSTNVIALDATSLLMSSQVISINRTIASHLMKTLNTFSKTPQSPLLVGWKRFEKHHMSLKFESHLILITKQTILTH